MNLKDITIYQILGWVFLALVFAAIVSGVYYLQMKNLPIDSAIVHQDLTADWKTYKNNQYGFEFKYPEEWYLNVDPIIIEPSKTLPEQNADWALALDTTANPEMGGSVGDATIRVFRYPNADSDKFKEWFNKYKRKENGTFGTAETATYGQVQIEDTTLSGAQAIKQRYIGIEGWVAPGPHKEIYFVHDNRVWELSFITLSPDNKNLEKKFDLLVSTFKFLEQEVCIQVIQRARNKTTGERKDFPTPCDVPEGWEKISPEEVK